MNVILSKLKEISFTVLPITLIVFIINFTLVSMSISVMTRFVIGTILVIIGLTLFLMGVDLGVTPFGDKTGNALAKKNSFWIVILSGLVLGFFISIAEPGLLVLGGQVQEITNSSVSASSIFIVVSIGLAFMISVGFIRVFYNLSLRKILFTVYGIIFILAFLVSEEFLGISFDASGATTGILAVPFILSLSTGVSKLKKDSIAGETDSFGLVALASSGAIVGVMLLNIFTPSYEFSKNLTVQALNDESIFRPYIDGFLNNFMEATISLGPLLVIYLALNSLHFKTENRENRKILTGFLMSYIGLILFLTGVNGGFMEVGLLIGEGLTRLETNIWIILISFVIGVITILAEPAVFVLTKQIEEITSGYVKRKVVSIFLSVGVGLAIVLSVLRILITDFKLWHILLVGYFISLLLTLFTPKLFIGIAFDAGGVATGPITATFILAFIQGLASVKESASLLIEGFGMIALVAMMPIITLQILGIIFKIKKKESANV